jgi:hypothetical protein
VLPLRPGVPERRTHDYKRNGTTNLYAALDVASGNVIADLTPRHRAEEFRRFLNLIDKSVPAHLDVHVILDNSSTHKTSSIRAGCCAIPGSRCTSRRPIRAGSTSSSAGRLSSPASGCDAARTAPPGELVASICTWITRWNDDPKPFVWHKIADEILDSLAAYCERISDSGH